MDPHCSSVCIKLTVKALCSKVSFALAGREQLGFRHFTAALFRTRGITELNMPDILSVNGSRKLYDPFLTIDFRKNLGTSTTGRTAETEQFIQILGIVCIQNTGTLFCLAIIIH